MAATDCRYVCWNRQKLDALFRKEQHLGTVMSHVIGRDITNKLFNTKTSAVRFDLITLLYSLPLKTTFLNGVMFNFNDVKFYLR